MTPTLATEIRHLRAQVDGRYVDSELVLQTKQGEVLMRCGGRWDRVERRIVGPALRPHVVEVKASQEKAARRFAEWCEKYDRGDPDRVSIEMYADRRRGGKTFFICLVVVCFLLRYALKADGIPQIGWIVVPAFSKQREIHETLRKFLPSSWIGPRGSWSYLKSERRYRLPSGAELYLKSGDDADLLKEGGVGIIGVNEAQEIHGYGIIYCLGNNIDSGGLTCIALNPPNKALGLWAMNLVDAIEKGILRYGRLTEFPPSGNDSINQDARVRFSEVARIIDPKQEQRDAQGMWIGITDLCYPFYRASKHIQPKHMFDGWEDITADVNGLTGCLMKGDLRPWGIGMDYQGRPWCGAVRGKALRAPEGNKLGLAAGTVCYVIHSECHNDVELGEWWHEDRLCHEMIERGWDPDTALTIGDGTGASQGSTGAQRGRHADPATFSFAIIRSYGYDVHAPIERVEYVRRPGQSTAIVPHNRNPPVPVRLDVTNTLLDKGRFYILSSCGSEGKQAAPLAQAPAPGGDLAESYRTCAASATKKPQGKGAHLTDAAGYLLYRWETALRESGYGADGLPAAKA